MNALSVSNLSFRYYKNGKRNIVDNLSLSVEAGSVTVILGKSGCGKSTFAALAAGLYPENGGFLSSGEIEIFGNSIKSMSHKDRAKYLSIMFQNPDLQFCMDTLRKEIIFCLENIAVPPDKMDDIIIKVSSHLGMSELLDRKLSSLSGGEKQKASLCCLTAINSKCIILDEALANIDNDSAKEIITILAEYKNSGGTVIAVEHRPELWRDIADRYVVMGEGCKILEENISSSDFENFRDILAANGIYGTYTGKNTSRCENSENAISIKNLSFKYDNENKYLLKNACADFKKSRITAILGRSGIGKTTTFLCILKQHKFDGTIKIFGKNIDDIRENDLFKDIGIVFQNPENQFVTQKVEDEIKASIKNPELLSATKLLEEYDLKQFAKYSPYMLSQGQQRRLAVFSMIAGNQKILLLDEPTYGQDLQSTENIMRLLNNKVEQDGLTVIFITHDEELADKWADDIFKIEDGKFIKC